MSSRAEMLPSAVNLLERILAIINHALKEESQLRLIAGAATTMATKLLCQEATQVWNSVKRTLDVGSQEPQAAEKKIIGYLRGSIYPSEIFASKEVRQSRLNVATWLNLALSKMKTGATVSDIVVDLEQKSIFAEYMLLSSTSSRRLIAQPASKMAAAAVYFALRVQGVIDWDLRARYKRSYSTKELLPVYADLFAIYAEPQSSTLLQDCYKDDELHWVVECVDRWCKRELGKKKNPRKAASASL